METLNERHIHGTGTSEEAWLSHGPLQRLPYVTAADLVPAGGRAIIVAPHPDDEVLPCGGLLNQLTALNRDIVIVAVTDGERSHPGGSWWTQDRLRRHRPWETEQALSTLGCQYTLFRLGLPDGGVSARTEELVGAISGMLTFSEVVFCPWSFDGHPDHEATARACAAACASNHARLIEMPIWGWHWSSPSTTSLPWHRAVKLPLWEEEVSLKRKAFSAFASQVNADPGTGAPPILTPATLERFERPWEVYLT